jgi:hypothetical protein
VLRLIAGEPVERVSRLIGVPVFMRERWRETAEAVPEGRSGRARPGPMGPTWLPRCGGSAR